MVGDSGTGDLMPNIWEIQSAGHAAHFVVVLYILNGRSSSRWRQAETLKIEFITSMKELSWWEYKNCTIMSEAEGTKQEWWTFSSFLPLNMLSCGPSGSHTHTDIIKTKCSLRGSFIITNKGSYSRDYYDGLMSEKKYENNNRKEKRICCGMEKQCNHGLQSQPLS